MNSPFKKSGVKSKNVSGVGDAQAFIAHSKEQHSVSTGCDASTTPFKNITKNSSSSCSACTSTEPLPETNKIHAAAVMETQTEPGPPSTQRSEKTQDEDPDGLYFSRLFMRECSTQASKQAAEKTDCSKPEVAIDQPVPANSGDPMETQKTIPMSHMANPNYEAITCSNHIRHPIGPRSVDGSTASASTDGDSLDHEVKFQSVQLCLTSGIRLPDKIVLPQSD
ncbi:hypothetical protein BSKO_09313 [Bryopsis sp. KO-2023]|nr:hypothetical protein BSKO_09313 [Bryopsis sp. KO-2023]